MYVCVCLCMSGNNDKNANVLHQNFKCYEMVADCVCLQNGVFVYKYDFAMVGTLTSCFFLFASMISE